MTPKKQARKEKEITITWRDEGHYITRVCDCGRLIAVRVSCEVSKVYIPAPHSRKKRV